MGLFGRKLTPQELYKKWKTELRTKQREISRNIRAIEREEKKVEREVKKAAVAGDRATAKILAKELVMSRKSKEKMHLAIANLKSLNMNMRTQMASQKFVDLIGDVTPIMTAANECMKSPQLMQTMMTFQKEMAKAGLMQEMQDDVMDDVLGGEEESSLAEDAVNQVIDEITAGQFGASVPSQVRAQRVAQQAQEEEVADDIAGRIDAL